MSIAEWNKILKTKESAENRRKHGWQNGNSKGFGWKNKDKHTEEDEKKEYKYNGDE